jgi:hypothetical protein
MAEKQNAATEELQQEVLHAQLRTQKAILAREEASLEETMESLADRKQRKDVAQRTNANRQRQFALDRANQRHLQKNVCEHRAGGYAGETPITEGGGTNSFSVLHVTIMPDSKTMFIQCGRCPLKMYWRARSVTEEDKLQAAAEAVRKGNPKSYQNDKAWLAWEDHLWGKELMATHKKDGLKKSIMKGPTFEFEKDGMPFIPDITGWVTAGPRA